MSELHVRCAVRSATRSLASLLLVLGCVTAHGVEAQEVKLAWQFRPGDTHVYLQTNSSRSETPVGDVTQAQTIRMRKDVLAVGPDGAADLRVTHEAFQMETDGPMGHQRYDSESGEPAPDLGTKILGQMVGTSFQVTMKPDGGIRQVSGMDEIFARLLAAYREDSPETDAEVEAMLEGMLDAEHAEAQMQQMIHALPSDPVAPGAEWSTEMVLHLPMGTALTEYTYRLEEVVVRDGRRVAVIGITGRMGPMQMADNPIAAMLEITGLDLTGTMEFAVDRGLVLRTSATTVMEAAVMGMTMRVEGTSGMDLVE